MDTNNTYQSKDNKAVNQALSSYVNHINLDNKVVAESMAVYGFNDFFQNKMHIIQAIRRGIPYSLFDLIRAITPFTEQDWARYLDISIKSLHRYKADINFLFKPIHTEKIIEIAEVTLFGNEVFDSKDQFYTWLNTPSYALGQLLPADLLSDSYGKELVMAELNRIEHGIFV